MITNYIMLLLLIELGKYQVKDMNVYIEPLIYELLELWNGVTMYDISRTICERKFQFRAVLVWTIHNTPRLTHFYAMQNC